MKRAMTVGAMAAAALALAAPSQAAAPPTNRQLAKQIKTLKAQVKALQTQLRQTRLLAIGTLAYAGCSAAATADTFQGTWAVIDEVSNRAQPPKTWFGPQQPVNDSGVCAAFNIQRTPTQVPPNVTIFNSLLRIFQS